VKAYVITRETGGYSDYRSTPILTTLDKGKAETFAKAAKEEAWALRERYEEIYRPLWHSDGDLLSSEDYDAVERKAKKLKSKSDPGLSPDDLQSVSYCVSEVRVLE
jgi:hypothetical protein